MTLIKKLCLHRFIRASFLPILLYSSTAIAVCFNPLGCEPETEADCINKVDSAKTEAGAKALIAKCRKLPKVTLSQCKAEEKIWSQYMTANKGVEWEYPGLSVKEHCKKQFSSMFPQAMWLTSQYCSENAARIKEALAGTDPETMQSHRLTKAKREIPELSGLENHSIVDVLKSVYYPDMPAYKLAAFLYIDSPPEVGSVAEQCSKLSANSKRPQIP